MEKYLENEKIVYSSRSEKEKEFDFTLAEYMPGISRIISTIAEVEKCHFNKEENSAAANVKFNIIYVSDFGDKIKNACFSEVISASVESELPEAEDVIYTSSCFVSSESARLISSRKVTVKCNFSFNVTGFACERKELFCAEQDGRIYVQKKDICCLKKTTLPEVIFETSNEVAVGENESAVGEIIYSFACPKNVTARAENGAVAFNFVLSLYAIYEPSSDEENEEDKCNVLSSDITISERIENSNITEGSIPYLFIDILSSAPSVSFDPYGENKLVSFSTKYSVSTFLYDEKDCEIVTDAFGEKGTGDAVFASLTTQSLSSKVKNRLNISEKINTDIGEMRKICACKAKICQVWTEQAENGFFENAVCLITVFATDDGGFPIIKTAGANLHIPIDEAVGDGSMPDTILSIESCSGYISEGELICNFDIFMQGIVYGKNTIMAVSTLGEAQEERSESKSELIVYYPTSSDTLWNIAKKYKVNPELLCKVNGIENAGISGKRIVLIP